MKLHSKSVCYQRIGCHRQGISVAGPPAEEEARGDQLPGRRRTPTRSAPRAWDCSTNWPVPIMPSGHRETHRAHRRPRRGQPDQQRRAGTIAPSTPCTPSPVRPAPGPAAAGQNHTSMPTTAATTTAAPARRGPLRPRRAAARPGSTGGPPCGRRRGRARTTASTTASPGRSHRPPTTAGRAPATGAHGGSDGTRPRRPAAPPSPPWPRAGREPPGQLRTRRRRPLPPPGRRRSPARPVPRPPTTTVTARPYRGLMPGSADKPAIDAILQKVLEAVPFQLTVDGGIEEARRRLHNDLPAGPCTRTCGWRTTRSTAARGDPGSGVLAGRRPRAASGRIPVASLLPAGHHVFPRRRFRGRRPRHPRRHCPPARGWAGLRGGVGRLPARPRAPYPAAVDDVWAATRWVADNAGRFGADGSSSQSPVTPRAARCRSWSPSSPATTRRPAVAFQLLWYPSTMWGYLAAVLRRERRGAGAGRHRDQGLHRWYAGEVDLTDPRRGWPRRAADLSGLPPAYIAVAGPTRCATTAPYRTAVRRRCAGRTAQCRDAGARLSGLRQCGARTAEATGAVCAPCAPHCTTGSSQPLPSGGVGGDAGIAQPRANSGDHDEADYETLIVGTGFSGIGAAINLDKAGLGDYQIIDGDGVGGFLVLEHLSGIAVDIPSFSYQFSLRESPDWTRTYAPGRELHGVRRTLRRQVRPAPPDPGSAPRSSARGSTTMTASGASNSTAARRSPAVPHQRQRPCSSPNLPDIDSVNDSFAGLTMHTARWDHTRT